MSKVGIIGDKDTVMGFLALGIDIFPAYSAEEIKKTIHTTNKFISNCPKRIWKEFGIEWSRLALEI